MPWSCTAWVPFTGGQVVTTRATSIPLVFVQLAISGALARMGHEFATALRLDCVKRALLTLTLQIIERDETVKFRVTSSDGFSSVTDTLAGDHSLISHLRSCQLPHR